MTCQFCKIVDKNPAWVVWHGEDVVSFKPFGALHPQHRMFVPLEHVAGAGERPELTARCFEEAARWAAGKGHPFNLIVNSGPEAGQSVEHVHIHYVPRKAGDGLVFFGREIADSQQI